MERHGEFDNFQRGPLSVRQADRAVRVTWGQRGTLATGRTGPAPPGRGDGQLSEASGGAGPAAPENAELQMRCDVLKRSVALWFTTRWQQVAVAAFIASQREAHGIPHSVSLPGAGSVPDLVLQVEGRQAAAAVCAAGAAESRGGAAVRRTRRAGRVAAGHGRAARGRLAGEREHRRGPDARAGAGRPAREAPQGHHAPGQGPVAGRGPGQAEVRRGRDQPPLVRRRHRDQDGRGQALPGLGAGHGVAADPRHAIGSITTRRWLTGRWPWRWRSAAVPFPAWSFTPTRAASTPRAASGRRASGSGSPSRWEGRVQR